MSSTQGDVPIPQLVVEKVRVVAHTMGPVTAGGQLSQNHWSIYLLTQGGGSVRLNMAANPQLHEDKGIFTVTRHAYDLTTSAVRCWDFPAVKHFIVGDVLRLIQRKGRHRYRMTTNGVGCRHWMYATAVYRIGENMLTFVSEQINNHQRSDPGGFHRSKFGEHIGIHPPVQLFEEPGTYPAASPNGFFLLRMAPHDVM